MIRHILTRTHLGRRLVRHLGQQRVEDIYADLHSHLRATDRVLDIGAGPCDVTARFLGAGYDIHPIDIADWSCVDGIRPQIVDGRTLPFAKDTFDVALLVNVLHHVADPDELLSEASRVAKRVILHEDVYTSDAQRIATYVMDSIVNLEVIGHPHTNRDDRGWRETFARHGLDVAASHTKVFWRWFANATYVVERSERT